MTEEKRRSVDNWWVEEMLGKGGYSWVRKGIDKKTGKAVALKFMKKAAKFDEEVENQVEQVATEIGALQKVKHKNVLRLLAYNIHAKYPDSKGNIIDTILLVLELAPGGEMFDLLYYADKFSETIALAYFQQLISGLKACHEQRITHRDLKPQNLLLDKHFRLKIVDFGLSNILEDGESLMKTTYVGTKGYQAPELLLNRKYTNACDIFACGVILFIMLLGYPPFEESKVTDTWYKCIAQNKYAKFWKKHSVDGKVPISQGAMEVIQMCVCYQPTERATIADIEKHEWFNQKSLSDKQLKKKVQQLHTKSLKAKANDSARAETFNESNHRDLEDMVKELPKIEIPTIPEHTSPLNTFNLLLDKNENPRKEVNSILEKIQKLIIHKKGKIDVDGYSIKGFLQTNEGSVSIIVSAYKRKDSYVLHFKRQLGGFLQFKFLLNLCLTQIKENISFETSLEDDDFSDEENEQTKTETNTEGQTASVAAK